MAWFLLAALTALTLYGFLTERLWAQDLWSSPGTGRFLGFAAAFWTLAILILWRSPRWLPAITTGIVLLYTAWWAGPSASIAVLFLLGSCYLLGRRLAAGADTVTATLVGSAVWMLAIWCALHFPVNHRWSYAAVLLIPYVLESPNLRGISPRRVLAALSSWPNRRTEAAALAVLLFVLLIHWLGALKPEISADGLSMHLALPVAVAQDGQWGFDLAQGNWALMPKGADCLYAAAYLLGGSGGETAARLLNFAFLALCAALLAGAARRWTSPAISLLIAALFVSTPLVQLVTGSLFVENVWAALVLAATLALLRYLDPRGFGASGDAPRSADLFTSAALCGAALACKVMAAAFVVPAALIAIVAIARDRINPHWRAGLAAAALLAALALPPYLDAYLRTGNPVFPFMNATFGSPYYDTQQSFSDPRFAGLGPAWDTLYEMTVRSHSYFEGQGGAAGFQFLLFLLPAVLLIRRASQAALLAMVFGGAVIMLIGAPNLRYLFPALALAMLPIAWLMAGFPRAAAAAVLTALTAVNLFFLPTSGWYDRDFALFHRDEVPAYIEDKAPVRLLLEHLNRTAPGEPVAMFATDSTAGLRARAYTDGWHTGNYWRRVRTSKDPQQILDIMHELGIAHVIAPASRHVVFTVVEEFLRQGLNATGPTFGPPGNRMALFRVRNRLAGPPSREPLGPGLHDDTSEAIDFDGAWVHDSQWTGASGGTLTYSEAPGDRLRVPFTGTAVTYLYTAAPNRGIAELSIDGSPPIRVDLFDPGTAWQTRRKLDGLSPGVHELDLRVTGDANPASSGRFVDLDAFLVEP